jgi:uncharacterized protein (TIGR04255 family)
MPSLWPQLRQAPIVEGLLDLRVIRNPDTTIATLDSISEIIASDYPEKKSRQQPRQFAIRVDPGQAPAVDAIDVPPDGFTYTSKTKRYVFQSQLDGFTLSRLPPYETWQELRNEARNLWSVYTQKSTPLKITRIGVRYINNLMIPLPVSDMHEFLRVPIGLASGLPRLFTQFFSVVQSPWPSYEAQSIVQVRSANQIEDKLPITLDIEVYRHADIQPNNEQVWKIFDELRDIKNRIFFESLTYRFLDLCNLQA